MMRTRARSTFAALGILSLASIPTAAGPAAEELAVSIASKLDALQARTSLHAKHLPSGREIAVRADEPMNTLSVIKVPIMLLAFRDAETGTLDLDERYRIRPEDLRRGSGLLQTFSPGLEPSYRDLVTQMIITSDNTATDIIIGKVGLDRVNALLSSLGYQTTRLQTTVGALFRRVWELLDPAHASLSDREVFERGFPHDEDARRRSFAFEGEPREWLGRSTARETSRLLEQMYRQELASGEHSQEMIAILKQQLYRSRLPRRIHLVASVAHKTGDWTPIAANDVGIIFHPGGPSVISVYVNQNRDDFLEVEETIGDIAETIVRAWGLESR